MAENLDPYTLRKLIETADPSTLNARLEPLHAHDIAAVAMDLDNATLWRLLQTLKPPRNVDVFSHLPVDRQVQLVEGQAPKETADLLEKMHSDDRVDLVQQLDPAVRERVLTEMEPEERQDVERLSVYPEGTVGSVMSSDVATLRCDITVGQAIDQLRRMSEQKETIYYNYVVDSNNKLLGIVSLRDLILTPAEAKLQDVMNTKVVSVSVDDPVEVAAKKIREYDLLAIPVVHGEDRLAGIITVDDVLDVQEEETTIDFHKMAPVGLMKVNLREAGLRILVRARAPWLLILVFMNIFSGAGIAYFEDTLAAMISLAFFLPLLIDSGGNAGSQAATLMVRALATGQVMLRDWIRLLSREILVAGTLGVLMALAVGMIAAVRAPDILLIVSCTMVLTVLFGSLVGMSLPFILTRFKLDPATASAPLITSIADIGGVLIYFSIATWWLGDAIKAAAEVAGA